MRTNIRISKIMAILVAVCLMMQFAIIAIAEIKVPSATAGFYVNDFANLFSDEQEDELMLQAEALAKKPEGVQVVITTVKSLDGASLEDYATSMYNKYEIGREDRGVLILLTVGERQIRVEVGYGLESYLTDSKTGGFIREYAIDYLKNNQFDKGLIELQKALITDLDNHFETLNRPKVTATPKVQVTNAPVLPANQTSSKADTKTTSSVSDSKEQKDSRVTVLFAIAMLLALWFLAFLIRMHKYVINTEENKKLMEEELSEANSRYAIVEKNLKHRHEQEIYYKEQELEKERRERSEDAIRNSERITRMSNEWREKNNRLEKQLLGEKNARTKAEEELDALKKRFGYAVKIYPNLNSEIDSLIQKEIDESNRRIATSFDEKYQKLMQVQASTGADVFAFENAIFAYESLNHEQQKYVRTNMDVLRKTLAESRDMINRKKAQEFSEKVKSTCAGISQGEEKDLPSLQSLRKSYDSLQQSERKYVDIAAINVLKNLIMQGESARKARIAAEEAERRRQEEERRRREEEERKRREEERRRKEEEERKRREEERRRREREEEEEEHWRRMRQMSDSSSSSSFGSSYTHFGGGFGGHSGGGGASSGF